MTEEKEDNGENEQSESTCRALVRREPDPEIGLVGVVRQAQKRLNHVLFAQLMQVIDCIVDGVKKGNAPSAKMLLDLVLLLDKKLQVPEQAYQSLAEVLWKEYQEQQLGTKGLRD
jgi:hypothetical protein